MSAKDLFHEAARKGLEKDGWTITNDPLHLRIGGVLDMYIDLGAEKIIAFTTSNRRRSYNGNRRNLPRIY